MEDDQLGLSRYESKKPDDQNKGKKKKKSLGNFIKGDRSGESMTLHITASFQTLRSRGKYVEFQCQGSKNGLLSIVGPL